VIIEFKTLVPKAKEIKAAYAELNKRKGEKNWGVAQYAQELVGDIGDLMKLVMAKEGFRTDNDVDEKLAHELADCLWASMILADELGIDLEAECLNTMEEIQKRIS
jgi:NTP pyrophosphatase (non-canonical NTP hydrolase)